METWEDSVLVATDSAKVHIFTFKDDKLDRVRSISVDASIEKIVISNGRLLVNGKGITKVMSLEGDILLTYYKS